MMHDYNDYASAVNIVCQPHHTNCFQDQAYTVHKGHPVHQAVIGEMELEIRRKSEDSAEESRK